MKGIGEIASFVIVVLIVVVAIGVVVLAGIPAIEQARENAVMNEAKQNLLIIDNLVKQVASEGTGAVREVVLGVSDGTYRINPSQNSLDFELGLKSPVLPKGTYTKVGNLVTIVGGSADASKNSTSLIIQNELIEVVFRRIGNQSNFDGINTSNIINTIRSKASPTITIRPNNTGVTIQSITNTSWGLGYSDLAFEGSNLPRAGVLAHVRSNMTGVEYEVLYTLPASEDFMLVEVRNTTSNQTTFTYTYTLGTSSSNDVIKIGNSG